MTPEEAGGQVLREPIATDVSRTSGNPIAFGYTDRGRKLAVVYEEIDGMTVCVLTAYDVE